MNNKTYKMVFCILVMCILSVIFGFLRNTNVEQYKRFKLYTVDSKNNVSDNVDKTLIKDMNILNDKFCEKYKSKFKINILPEEGVKARYRIRFNSINGVSDKEINNVYDDYVKTINENNKVFHVSPLDNNEIQYKDARLSTIIISVMQAILYSIALIILFNVAYIKVNHENISFITSVILFIGATAFGQFAILLCSVISFSIIANIIQKNKEYKNSLIKIAWLALILRVLVSVAIMSYNFIKYRTFLSYTQTDEIFYYSTGDYIYQSLVNFKWPNLKTITGIDQYGYNFFIGFIKFINNSDIFITVKLINILVSVIFVLLIFNFVYIITNNKNIAKMSSVLIAIMPTFAVFSAFALRDIVISINIFLLFYIIVCSDKFKNRIFSITGFILLAMSLWFLRRYALLLTLMLTTLYLIVRFLTNRKINIIAILISMAVIVYGLIVMSSRLYGFSIFNMIKGYILSQGIAKTFSGVILSLVNLDFLINIGATIYNSPKYMILRIMYPETIFLVVTFPIMALGMIKASRKDISFVITTFFMFVGFILIYKIQYGGWFLRTQLQIFPFQYIFIAWGVVAIIYDSNSKVAVYARKLINKI
ncbi:hypothetical protein [Clostridium folliculivorans]|uniref:Uncharacterized protein n=1 Tax=Clostridium folliculivorans TaxID=2886038 RepID=A0A9W6DBX6_9CLOT|nr:hypothetical protein [Clostridium folliculivorans]GKU26910.1 hypothetical protein CFOLD11_37370 [Clostridium folliculivorans]GKU31561.1 hypothetical protein CFB3_36680 [Clostridium folliculivorans]